MFVLVMKNLDNLSHADISQIIFALGGPSEFFSVACARIISNP